MIHDLGNVGIEELQSLTGSATKVVFQKISFQQILETVSYDNACAKPRAGTTG